MYHKIKIKKAQIFYKSVNDINLPRYQHDGLIDINYPIHLVSGAGAIITPSVKVKAYHLRSGSKANEMLF